MTGDDLLDYLELFGALGDCDVDYVVVGGLAVNAHGVIRSTADADIVPGPARSNLARLRLALDRVDAHVPGADPLHDPLDPSALAAGASVKCETKFGPLHIVQSQPGQPRFDELLRRAMEVEIEGRVLPVCSYEHLVTMKKAAGRPQDEIDLADLRAARGED